MVWKWLRIAHDAAADGVAYQTITVASTLWVQTMVRPHNCTPRMELLKVGEETPQTIWTGQDDGSMQYTGTVRVADVVAGDYDIIVGSADLEVGAYVDVLMLSAQTTMISPTQLVPVDDGVGIDDAVWLAGWTALDAALSVVNEEIG